MLLIFNEHHNLKHYHHLMVFIFENKNEKKNMSLLYIDYILYILLLYKMCN